MKNVLIGIAVTIGVLVLLGLSQDETITEEFADLRTQIATLGLRVDRLEHAAGGSPYKSSASSSGSASGATSASGAAAEPGAPTRSMVLVSISETHNKSNDAEITQLKQQSAALMNAVNSKVQQKYNDASTQLYASHMRGGVRGWGGGVSGGEVSSNVGAVQREVFGDQQMENRYATLKVIKDKKLKTLQHAASEPQQIIVGHDGATIITLETKHNETKSLDQIAIGERVTWTGIRLNADADSEHWRIESIQKVD